MSDRWGFEKPVAWSLLLDGGELDCCEINCVRLHFSRGEETVKAMNGSASQHAPPRVQRLVATCLNDACGHQGLIDVSKYPGDTEVPRFANKIVCAKCGARGRHIDVRPN